MEKDIKKAVDHFETLLRKQIKRNQEMKSDPKDFGKLENITVGFVGGDGIGPVITEQAKHIFEKLMAEEILSGKVKVKEIKGLTIENREKCKKAVPGDVLAEIKECDVLLKGPTTTPKGGSMESANVALRRELDLFANIRPVKVPELGIDWMFFRENTEGEYVLGSCGIEIPDQLTMDFKVTTENGTDRIVKKAAEYAKANDFEAVEVITKANIMKKTDGMFSERAHNIIEGMGLKANDWYIDIMTAKLLDDRRRKNFHVFVLPNLYGDIITDEAAEIQGGVGTAGSVNAGDRYAMFEAIHGSAPRMVEEGRDKYANPESIMRALVMLLNYIGYEEKAAFLEKALDNTTKAEKMTAVEFGSLVTEKL